MPPDSLRQVSTQVTRNALEALTAQGWLVQPDLAALGLDPDVLWSGRHWISWSDYLAFLRAVGGPDADDAVHRRVGGLVMAHAAQTPFRHLGPLLGGARPLFEATYGWILAANIKVLRARTDVPRRGHLRLELALSEDLEPGQVFFHSVAGTMERLPEVLGLRQADVDATIGAHHATYEVRFPLSVDLISRVRQAAGYVIDRPGVDVAMFQLRENLGQAVIHLRDTNDQLSASEARWRALTANLPGLVTVVDRDGRIVGTYGSDLPQSGTSGGQWILDWVAPDDRARVGALLPRVLAGERVQFETRRIERDGGYTWWTCRAGPLPGPPAHAVVVAIDITERRRAEEALRASEQNLVQAQKMEAIGRLAGGLAHDVNNVLASVRGQADLLGLQRGEDPTVSAAVAGIVEAVERASALTRRLLAYGQARTPEPEVVDLNLAIRDTAGLLRRIIGEDVTLVARVDESPLAIRADPAEVQQVLLNLVINARDALPGGGRVEIRTAEVELGDGEGLAPGCYAVLTVSDDGPGMDDETRARAFEPFFTTKPPERGSGLGLPTVQWIAEQAGGRVTLQSQPGGGTQVAVWLPRASAPTVVAPAPSDTLDRRGSGQAVLLVEDEPEVRGMIAQMLEAHGYRVVACGDGREALEAETRHPDVDLLVTDIVMPGMTGIDLAKNLHARRPDLPVLFVSGFTTEDPGGPNGAPARRRFLRKPFGMRDLGAAVAALLDG